MKLLCLCSIGLLALSGCDAFDEGRLVAQHAAFARARDASTPEDPEAPIPDAAASDRDDDPTPLIGERDEPRLPRDASADEAQPEAPASADEPGEDAGIEDVDAELDALRGALAHRYTFNGTGATVQDACSGAQGTIVNAELTGQGTLVLAGGSSDQYVDLPNDLLSGLDSVTIEAWVTWSGGLGWQRIFDFGSSDAEEEGVNGIGASYLMLSPAVNDRGFGASYAQAGPTSAIIVESAEAFAVDAVQHVALVFDGERDQMTIYLNGKLAGGAVIKGPLSAIDDRNNWIGRSQFSYDASFGGTLHEFRIYDRALGEAEIALSHEQGSDPAFLISD